MGAGEMNIEEALAIINGEADDDVLIWGISRHRDDKTHCDLGSYDMFVHPRLIITPYPEKETAYFLQALGRAGAFELPDARSAIIARRGEQEHGENEQLEELAEDGDVLCDLEEMDGVSARAWGEDGEMIPVWTKEVPDIDKHLRVIASEQLDDIVDGQWDTTFEKKVGFDELPALDESKRLACAMAMGKCDMSDVAGLYDRYSYDECDMESLKALDPEIELPDGLSRTLQKMEDIAAIWESATRSSSTSVVFRESDMGDDDEMDIAGCVERAGRALGVDAMIDAYLSGVPVEDILA